MACEDSVKVQYSVNKVVAWAGPITFEYSRKTFHCFFSPIELNCTVAGSKYSK